MRELESSLQQFGEFLLEAQLVRPGLAGVWMPDALDRKYPNAGRELAWFWVFPSRTLSSDPRAGIVRRHHVSDSVVQKAVKAAAQEARILKPVSVHTLRHASPRTCC